jgi:hypothetical protein
MKQLLTGTAFLFVAFLLPATIAAQEYAESIKAVRQRTEKFLQTIRDEKWDELHRYVVIVTHKGRDEKTVEQVTDSPEDDNSRSIVVSRLKAVYERLKPGQIRSIRLAGIDNSAAFIGYRHGDLDGFDMILFDGEWFYTIEVWQ